MLYNPPLDTPIKVVELINQLGQIFENRGVHNASLEGYKYLTVGFNGYICVYQHRPHLNGMVWQHEFMTPSKKLDLVLPSGILNKVNSDNFKYLVFELGGKVD